MSLEQVIRSQENSAITPDSSLRLQKIPPEVFRTLLPGIPISIMLTALTISTMAHSWSLMLGGWTRQSLQKERDPDDEGRERLS